MAEGYTYLECPHCKFSAVVSNHERLAVYHCALCYTDSHDAVMTERPADPADTSKGRDDRVKLRGLE
jgi:DNA-directed RNA polymerase subunit RPC12/RpoP